MTKARIINVAQKLFKKHGFAGTSMQMVADEVGIKKSSLYYFFRSKEELYLVVVGELFESIQEIFTQKEEENFEKKLERLFKTSLENVSIFGSTPEIEKEKQKDLHYKIFFVLELMEKYLSKQKIRIPPNEAILLILDVAQSYAKRSERGYSLIKPKEYAKVVNKLLIK